ncbi:amidase [Teichococcus deserti]|nr:amidase family protein [Pseudoroseomonas deserti]
MTDTELAWMPATKLAALIRQKQVSPLEVTTAVLAQAEAAEPRINALAHLAAEAALAAARRAEQAVMRGDRLGPLHGVTATLKDLTPTADMPMQSGSQIFAGHRPTEDAPVATRLVEAGAIVIGKTTTSEFGWTGVSRSPLTGITSNPWKAGYNAGASSAGAGAAAAAGYGPLHQGSDGAGSIRMPAHFCGIYGLKPSFGRVPYYPPSVGDLTSHIGPMTRHVADAALMLQVMAGPHPWDFTSAEAPPADYPGLLHQKPMGGKTLRIGWSADLGHARVDPDVAAISLEAARALAAALGSELEPVATPWGPTGVEIGRFFWSAHMSRWLPELDKWESRMDPGLVACIRDGAPVSAGDYQRMRTRKYAYVTEIHRFMAGLDLLVTPAVSVAAFPAKDLQPAHWPQHPWDWLRWAEFSYPFNMSGHPAASLPAGFTGEGLPVGLQIVGQRFDDLSVLQASAAFEQARPWAGLRPPLA